MGKLVQMLFVGRKSPYFQMIEKEIGDEWRLLRAVSEKGASRIAGVVPLDVAVVDGTSPRVNAEKIVAILRKLCPTLSLVVIAQKRSDDVLDPPGAYILEYPFSHEDLLRVVRRAGSQKVDAGPFTLDLNAHALETPTGFVHLTPKETNLLMLLFRNAGRTLSRKEIMQNTWETDYMEDVRTLYVHIRWLRSKLEPDPSHPRYILTVRGIGYRFNPNGKV